MSDAHFDDTDPAMLSELLSLEESARGFWREDELGSVLRHQLTVPFRDVAASLDQELERERGTLTVGEILTSSGKLDELELLKRFAKMNSSCDEALFPEPVGMVLYFSSIGAARFRFGARLSTLDDQELRKGLRWCLQHEWIDEKLRTLVEDARTRVD